MDSICFKGGILGFSSPISFGGVIEGRTHTAHVSALGRGVSANANGVSIENSPVTLPSQRVSPSGFSFTKPLGFLWRSEEKVGGGDGDGISLVDEGDVVVNGDESDEDELTQLEEQEDRHESWVLKILHARSRWEKNNVDSIKEKEEDERVCVEDSDEDQSSRDIESEVRDRNCFDEAETSTSGVCEDEICGVCDEERNEEEEEKIKFDRDSFSRLLRKVSLKETELYAKMSYLGNLAYSIPKIKPVNLMKYHGLRFVTSSVEKKEMSMSEQEKAGSGVEEGVKELVEETEEQRKNRYQISASAAYHIAASAASYLQSHTKNILSFKSSKDGEKGDSRKDGEGNGNADSMSSENASFVATTNSVTAVVAGEEEMKQAVAKDLNSAVSSPCEWFICDDDESATRFFVIQGSESMASWQANLLFEPIPFEGLDVLVHRGIYEAAKGIYEQMLPEVRSHLKSRGDSATLRFTGHSLGGSLALLINLMLLIRGEVPRSCLLPVITFGAPSILCGGDQLLRRLGLPKSHVKGITMHRDIVPRAFSCNYPNHVAEILKAVNGNFRNHPCLKNQKLLYAPMGEILILQPEEKFSPHHELLPTGSGLYLLSPPGSGSVDAEKQLRAAQSVFFNSPHPLDMLSDRSAYGSDGTVYRDHDVYAYLRSVLGVIRVEVNQIRKVKREHRREAWWPLVASRGGVCSSIVVGHQVATSNFMSQQHQPSFSGVFRTGRESVKRFSRLVASQHMHLLIVLLFPARMLLLGVSFR